jgi:hypothetical protein
MARKKKYREGSPEEEAMETPAQERKEQMYKGHYGEAQHHKKHKKAHHRDHHETSGHHDSVTGGKDMAAHSSHHEANAEHEMGLGFSPPGGYECGPCHGAMGNNVASED